jgi:hypothetical protein
MTNFVPKITPSSLSSNQNAINSLIKKDAPYPYTSSQGYLANFPKDFYPTAFSKNYKQFYPQKYYIPSKRKKESWLGFLNPFECESDYDDADDDDDDDEDYGD